VPLLSGAVKDMTDVRFLKNVIEESHGSGASKFLGWYPSLFYKSREDSGKWDHLVADVFTDVPDDVAGDPGCVLHEAVGNINSMLVTIDCGASVICYAGPVLSHYEFTCPINVKATLMGERFCARVHPPIQSGHRRSLFLASTLAHLLTHQMICWPSVDLFLCK